MMAKCIALAAIAVLAVCAASPLSKHGLVREEVAAPALETPDTAPETPGPLLTGARRLKRLPHISENQRELMSRQILQALSDIIQRDDCVMDYQGWVDFGRRSA